jgi:hypothetical protein
MSKQTKQCTQCKEIKPITKFYKRGKYEALSWCKICLTEYKKTYYRENIKRIKEHAREYYKNNIEKFEKYHKDNAENIREQGNVWHKNKRKKEPMFRLNCNISTVISNSLKGNKNGYHWEKLVGYSLKDLITYIEQQFKEGMNWNNYGKYGWHIDHIIPKSLWQFNSYSDREFKQCWALCNLQPLWAEENLRKNKKI